MTKKIPMFTLLCLWTVLGLAEQPLEPDVQRCGDNPLATQLAQLIKQHPAQKRPQLQCNSNLTEIAQQRAEQLANNAADPGITPNQILIKGGFRVPSYYPVSGNQVEALAKDIDEAEQAMVFLNASSKYHNHVLGMGEFFGLQSQLGVGFFAAQDLTQHDQWVVMMAEPWKAPKIVFKPAKSNPPIIKAPDCDSDWKNSEDEMLKSRCGGFEYGRAPTNKRTRKN